jgi:hypothetical protein
MSIYRQQMKIDNSIIVVDYYQGAYGPTIRIDIQTRENLVKLKDIFLQLAKSKKETTDLVTLKSVNATGLKQLILKVISSNQEREKKLKLEEGSTGNVAFSWSMSSAGWQRCAGLMDGLLEPDRPGHQYLTEEDIDDALVEVAFKE